MRQVALAARPLPDEEHTADEKIGMPPERRGRSLMIWVAAAAAILTVGVGTAWEQGWLTNHMETPAIAETRFASPPGRRATIRLADGSRVTLDSDSAVVARFSAKRREVELLRGQAYFEVAHDGARPFVVSAAGSSVTDLGTEFDVMIKPQGMRVVLVKGSVTVTDKDVRLTLLPGQGYDSAPATRGLLRVDDMKQSLTWRAGYLEFRGETLADAVAEMNRHSRSRIVLADPSIANLSVTGRFEAGANDRFARVLAEIYGLQLTVRPDACIELRRRR
jgi:transmembrane sensor